MAGKLFSKVAVVGLIAINLGAYYVLWPANSPNPFSADPPAGRTTLKREDAAPGTAEVVEAAPAPKPLAPGVKLAAAAPEPAPRAEPAPTAGASELTLPAPPEPVARAEEKTTKNTPEPGALPAPLAQADPLTKPDAAPSGDRQQRDMLESLKKQVQGAPTTDPAPASAGAPLKLDNSPWSLQMEIVEGRTLLRARLHKSAEFKVLCDRVEMKAPDGAVQAVGKVTLTGPGVTASCQRLSLPLAADQLVLDGQAEAKIADAAVPGAESRAAWELKGEHLTLRPAGLVRWQSAGELKTTEEATRPAVRPAAEVRWPERTDPINPTPPAARDPLPANPPVTFPFPAPPR